MQELTQNYLKEILHYNPKTGEFTWIEKKQGRRLEGAVGSIDRINGLKISINGKDYYAHRLACLYITGSFPPEVTDHINHNKLDNRWANLRQVSQKENQKNRSINANNTSGFNGVCWHKLSGKWIAHISINGKAKHLGYFTELSEAIVARQKANIKYGFHFNHGV